MTRKIDSLIAALALVRFGQELGTGGKLAPLVAEAIGVVIQFLDRVK